MIDLLQPPALHPRVYPRPVPRYQGLRQPCLCGGPVRWVQTAPLTITSPPLIPCTTSSSQVMVVDKPACAIKRVIGGLNIYIRPRLTHIITHGADAQEKCEIFDHMAPNIRCYQADSVLPGFTTATLRDYLYSMHGDIVDTEANQELAWLHYRELLMLGAAAVGGALEGTLTIHTAQCRLSAR